MAMSLSIPWTLVRAKEAAAKPAKYVLGAGGRNPNFTHPFTKRDGKTGADCVGFALWCRGLDRYQPELFTHYDGWMNTDSILNDALTGVGGGRWRVLRRPEPGCLVVYPSIRENGKLKRLGHVGVVVGVPAEWPGPLTLMTTRDRRALFKSVRVIDCAGSLVRRLKGRAIAERDASIWADDGRFVQWVEP